MPVTFAGYGCIEPRALYRDCADRGVSVAWADRPNSFHCPIGMEPGEGWVLMRLSDLRRVSPDLSFPGAYDLSFVNSGGGSLPPVTLLGLLVVTADCLTPGARGAESAYLVRLADRRVHLRHFYCDRAYNVRHKLSQEFLPQTLHGSQPWTWNDMARHVWERAGVLGGYPGLPVVTDGTPEDFEFYEVSVAEALKTVLDKLGCDLAYDPTVGSGFRIVEKGGADPAADGAMRALDAQRHWDGYPLWSARGSAPAAARVLFRKVPHVRGHSSPFVAVDAGAGPPGAEPGTVVALPDDLEALYTPFGVISNLSDLEARAALRAAEYFKGLASGLDRLRIVYPFAVAAGLTPGPQIDSIRWSEPATPVAPHGGLTTEVRRAGEPGRPSWPDVAIDPLTEVVRVTGSGSPPAGLLDGVIDYWDPASQNWVTQSSIWVVDPNAAGADLSTTSDPDAPADYSLTTGGGYSLTAGGNDPP